MVRIVALAGLIAAALSLGACGFADSRAPVPEFMRIKEAEPPAPEPQPDVKRVVREQLDIVFVPTSYPRDVQVAPPHREVRGPGWTACVRAQLTSATGSPLGAQTYIVTITSGKVVDRRRAEADDICGSETYEPAQLRAGPGTAGKNLQDRSERSSFRSLVTAEGSPGGDTMMMKTLTIALLTGAGALAMASGGAKATDLTSSYISPDLVQEVRLVCDDAGNCYRTRGGARVVVRDSYGYAPRERYYERRSYRDWDDGPRAGVGIRAPGVSVGVGVGGDRW